MSATARGGAWARAMVARVAARVSRSMRAPARALARTAALAAVLVRSELADAGSVLPRAALSERRGQEGSDAPRGRSCSSLARVLCGLEAASGAGGRGRSRSEVERVRRGDEGGGDPLWRKGVLQGRAMGDWRVLELDLVGAGPRVRVVVVVLSSRELLLLSLLLQPLVRTSAHSQTALRGTCCLVRCHQAHTSRTLTRHRLELIRRPTRRLADTALLPYGRTMGCDQVKVELLLRPSWSVRRPDQLAAPSLLSGPDLPTPTARLLLPRTSLDAWRGFRMSNTLPHRSRSSRRPRPRRTARAACLALDLEQRRATVRLREHDLLSTCRTENDVA